MTKTTIKWYTKEEKTPDDGKVMAILRYSYITTLPVHKGHFNCTSDNLVSELTDNVILWAPIPETLQEQIQNFIAEHDDVD